MRKEALSKPMNLSDDIIPRVSSYEQHSVNKHGMFMLFLFCKFHPFAFYFIHFVILIIHGHAPFCPFLIKCSR